MDQLVSGTDIIIVAGAVIGWYFIQGRLARFIHPMRLELAREGEELLADARLSQAQRDLVRFQLENALDPWTAVIFTALLPFVVIGRIVGLRCCSVKAGRIEDKELRSKYERVDAMFTRSIVCANLLAGVIFLAELALLTVFFAIIGRPWEALNSAKRDAIAADMQAPHMFDRWRKAA